MSKPSRGGFDKGTRRKPLAFAADAAAMEFEYRFGTVALPVPVNHSGPGIAGRLSSTTYAHPTSIFSAKQGRPTRRRTPTGD